MKAENTANRSEHLWKGNHLRSLSLHVCRIYRLFSIKLKMLSILSSSIDREQNPINVSGWWSFMRSGTVNILVSFKLQIEHKSTRKYHELITRVLPQPYRIWPVRSWLPIYLIGEFWAFFNRTALDFNYTVYLRPKCCNLYLLSVHCRRFDCIHGFFRLF